MMCLLLTIEGGFFEMENYAYNMNRVKNEEIDERLRRRFMRQFAG